MPRTIARTETDRLAAINTILRHSMQKDAAQDLTGRKRGEYGMACLRFANWEREDDNERQLAVMVLDEVNAADRY